MENPDLKSVLESLIEDVWNRGDFSRIETYIAPKYQIVSDPGDPWDGDTIDISTYKVRVLYSLNAFPDLHFDLQEMLEENGIVVVRWVMSGTHKGDLPQLPATGKTFAINGMTFYYFEGSRVCGHAQVFDQLAFLSQIGRLALSPST